MSNRNATMTATVEEISEINFSGNIIPQSWFNFIKFPSGKPDLLGVMILSEIVYWYRPTEIRDEATGQVIGYKKKFKADKLQRNYQSFADQFGVSKRQVQDATRRLKEAGLITIELRIITLDTGMVLSNVAYFEPVVSKIKQITYPYLNKGGSCNQLHEGMQSNVGGHVIDYMTYTENTTKITTENNDDDTFHPAKELGAPEGAEKLDIKCDDETAENFEAFDIDDEIVWTPKKDPLEILMEYGIKVSTQNPESETCLQELGKYSPEQVQTIARVLKEKEQSGKIKNAAGLLVKDPNICGKILAGKFYPIDYSVQGKKKYSITNWNRKQNEREEYEIFVPPMRN